MTSTVRTRYAPSPTGNPHVGNIRTALFSWAFARAHGGQFLLRIEDTDRNRFVETSVQAIIDSLLWLGLDYDEGPGKGGEHGPYFQSQRLPLYRKAAETLIERGRAYRCFCTPERLDEMRAAQSRAKQPPGYDGLCRGISPEESASRARNEPHVLRFKMEREGETVLQDPIRGPVHFENVLQDDFVMLKSDGYPTYHLAVVVDDTEMQISHVIRGDEWISSAPKHLQLYQALGWQPPVIAHLPIILGANQKKLSKRDGDVALLDYRDNGYLPEAMVNFLAFLGWSLDDKTSHIALDELARHFSLERVVSNPAIFDSQRLDHLNGHYIRQLNAGRWRALVQEWADKDLPADVPRPLDTAVLDAAAPLLQERITRLSEIAGLLRFLFGFEAPEYDPKTLAERVGGDFHTVLRVLDAALLALDTIDPDEWRQERIESAVRSLDDTLGMKLRKYVPVLYVAIEGSPRGLPLFDSMALLGRDRTLQRLRTARAIAERHHGA